MNNFEEISKTGAAIIPKGTVINGNIEMEGMLEMYGDVNGSISSSSRINICGNVKGNIKANDLYTNDSLIEGDIDCVQGAVVKKNAVILGNINAESLVVDGAIQGNLDIKGCVTIGEKAVIDSDIKAKSLEVSNGAVINGNCTFSYAGIDINGFFPVVDEPVKEPVQELKESNDSEKENKGDSDKSSKSKASKK